MVVSDEIAIQRLAYNEGIVLKPYRDVQGYLTIGVGRCLDTNPLTEEEIAEIGHNCREQPITKAQAFYLLRSDLQKVKKQLDDDLPWWRELNADRGFVLIDLCFNLGIKKLLKFKNTLSNIAIGNWNRAADGLRASLYYKQVGKRAERNARCLITGVYRC